MSADWIRIEGQFFRKSMIEVVFVPEDDRFACVIRTACGHALRLTHHGDDAHENANRTRDLIARAVFDIPAETVFDPIP